MPKKKRAPSRKKLESLQEELFALARGAKALKNDYLKNKKGSAGWLFFFGSSSPNQYRLKNINEIERVVSAIEKSINEPSLSPSLVKKKSERRKQLKTHIKEYQTYLSQLKGAILAQEDEIYNTYTMRSPENRSMLYDSLLKLVNHSKIDNAAKEIYTASYNDWLKSHPKPELEKTGKEAKEESQQKESSFGAIGTPGFGH